MTRRETVERSMEHSGKRARGAVRRDEFEGSDTQRMQLPARVGLFALSVLVSVASVAGLMQVLPDIREWIDRPISKVLIKGDVHYLAQQRLQDIVHIYSGDRFFALDLDKVRTDIEAEPWIQAATARRRWPDVIEISLSEQVPIAFWNDDFVLNQRGVVFPGRAEYTGPVLPHLGGYAGSEKLVMENYHAINSVLEHHGIVAIQLQVDEKDCWQAVLTNGTRIVFGRGELLEKLNRFAALYEQELKARADQVKVVDLRYDNGAAVRWAEKVPAVLPVVPPAVVPQNSKSDKITRIGKAGFTGELG